MNYAAISCISIVIVLLLSSEIAQANGDHDIYPVIVSFLSWLVVIPHTIDGLHINVLLHTGGGAIVQTKTIHLCAYTTFYRNHFERFYCAGNRYRLYIFIRTLYRNACRYNCDKNSIILLKKLRLSLN